MVFFVVVWWCFGGGVFVVGFCSRSSKYGVVLCGVFVVFVRWCFCGGVFVAVFLWGCFGVFAVVFCVFVVVFLWWCWCGGVHTIY